MEHKRTAVNYPGACVYRPVFEAASKADAKNAARMNRFYETLAAAVKAYASSPDFPEGGRYYADYTLSVTDGRLTVSFSLRLRIRGRTLRRRTLTHTWENGVITDSEIRKSL